MDNYRRRKTSRRPGTTIEGFVSGKPRRVAPRFHPETTSRKTVGRPQLGNFKQADGLHSTGQGRVGFSADTAPIGRQPVRDRNGQIKIGKKKLRKSAIKGKRNWRSITKRASLALVALVLVGGIYLGIKAYMKSRNILAGGGSAAALQENVDPSQLKGEGDGRVNILLMGTGGASHDNGSYLVDTIIIASIDPINKEAALLSIPRDFYVKTDNSGSMRINAVFKTARVKALNKNPKDTNAAYEAGMDAMDDIVTKTMGIPIHYHAMIDFTGFEKAIDTVGGVDLNITEDLSVYEVMSINGRRYTLNVQPGRQHFDGFRALAFTRSRKTSTRGDFDRSERQREIIIALKDKITSLGTLANPLKINGLLDDFGDHARSNLTVSELLRVYEITQSIGGDKVESVSLVDEPNVMIASSNIGGASVQIPKAGLNNYSEIHNFVRNKLRDGYIKKENASVAILNGTTISGLAGRTSDELKSYGYNVLEPTDAPSKDYKHTILVDMRHGDKKYTKHYLEQRFNTTAVTKLPDSSINPGTADFVIILGTNEQNRLEN